MDAAGLSGRRHSDQGIRDTELGRYLLTRKSRHPFEHGGAAALSAGSRPTAGPNRRRRRHAGRAPPRRYAAQVAMDVDVMVPAYGDGPLIRQAITSVLEQDDPGWRLTISDDAASMENGELAGWLDGLGDDRIRYLPNPERLGINRNFQRCADLASADWVIVLGADDRLLPDCISRVKTIAGQVPEAAWIHTGARIIDDNGDPHLPMADRVKFRTMPKIDRHRVIGGEELAVSLLKGNWMYFPSCAFRRETLQRIGFSPGLDIVLDLDLYLRILLDGGTCVLLEKPGIDYRRHAASLSSTGADDGSRFAEECAYFERMAAVMTEAGWPRAAAAARRHWTSRMHAAMKIPSLLLARKWGAVGSMIKVAVSVSPRPTPST
jgi:GT2 family glycosyltransferase